KGGIYEDASVSDSSDDDAENWETGTPPPGAPLVDKVDDLIDEDPSWEGCRACLTIPCRWSSCVDYRSVGARKTQIRDELFRLIGLWDLDEVVTVIPLSCVRGGPTTLPRNEAISELR
ncbi:unnamed protein product, partial [Ectocarpus sp. 12 AP-2014]